LRGF
jgi:20S proteasome subunit alpha 3